MRRIFQILTFSIAGALSCGFFTLSAAQDAPPILRKAEIRGTINPASSDFLRSSVESAEKENAEALIIELDTPGGLVSSVQEMAQVISRSKVPVIVYVSPAGASATSAGALLTLASHIAVMAPGTRIGAAHPVDSSGKDVPGAMGEKVVNDTAAFARGLAELRGRNLKLAEEIVRKSVSFTAEEALKNRLIEVIASSQESLIAGLDGRQVKMARDKSSLDSAEVRTLRTQGAEVRVSKMSWGQNLLHIIANPNIAGLLMTLGFLLIYMEVSNPGITIAGALGLTCLIVAFISLQLLPIQWGGVALMVLGIGLMIAEPFVPTKGALAFAGVIAFVLGMVWMVDPLGGDLQISLGILIPIAIALGGAVWFIGWSAVRTRRLHREVRDEIGGDGTAGLSGYSAQVLSVSEGGLSGRAMVRGESWLFESEVPLTVGETASVVQVKGMKMKLVKKEG